MKVLLLFLIFISLSTFATDAPFVKDKAQILSESSREELDQLLEKVYDNSDLHFTVYLVESIGDTPIQKFNKKKLEKWGKRDGILLTIATKDRKVRMEAIGSFKDRLSNDKINGYIQDILVPNLKDDNYMAGVFNLVTEVQLEFAPDSLSTEEEDSGSDTFVLDFDFPIQLKETISNQGYILIPALLILFVLYPLYLKLLGKGLFSRGLYGAIFLTIIGFLVLPAIQFKMVAITIVAGFLLGMIGPNSILMIMMYTRDPSGFDRDGSQFKGFKISGDFK